MKRLHIYLLALLLLIYPALAFVEQEIYDCTNITSSGLYSLQKNIYSSPDYLLGCINIQVDNVILNLNNYSINGYSRYEQDGPYGIYAHSRNNITIDGKDSNIKNFRSRVTASGTGIYLNNVSNSKILNISLNHNDNGISLNYNSTNISLEYINSSNNQYDGIDVWISENISLKNIVSNNNGEGIFLIASDNNQLYGITTLNNRWSGIRLSSSSKNILRNTSSNNNTRNFNIDGYVHKDYDNDIDLTNVIGYDKKIYYNYSISNYVYDSNLKDVGMILCANCTNITIRDLNLSHSNAAGVYFFNTRYSLIENITVSHNNIGVYLFKGSNSNFLRNVTTTDNGLGISIYRYSSNNILKDCNSNNNGQGISIADSSYNILRNGNFSNNENNFAVWGTSDWDYYNDIDLSNIVDNDKRIYYNYSISNYIYDSSLEDVGTIICANCDNITVKDLDLSHKNSAGIYFYHVRNSMIENITSNNNRDGIFIYDSYKILISNTTTSDNRHTGLTLMGSIHNILNNFNTSKNQEGIIIFDSIDNRLYNLNSYSNGRAINILGETSNNSLVYDNIFGNISFSPLDLDTFGNLTFGDNSNIQIGKSWAYNSPAASGLNNSAVITLNLTGKNITNPVILKEGNPCEDCSILNYGNELISFNVNSWSNYSVTSEQIMPDISLSLLWIKIGSSEQPRSNPNANNPQDQDVYANGQFSITNIGANTATIGVNYPTDSEYNITISEPLPITLDPWASKSIIITSRIPEDLPSFWIDDQDKERENIGDITFTDYNTATELSRIPLYLQAKNFLDIANLEVSVNGVSKRYDDGDIVAELRPRDKIGIKVVAANNYKDDDPENLDFDDTNIAIFTDENEFDIDKLVEVDINAESSEEIIFDNIEVSPYSEDGSADLTITVVGEDDNGATQGEQITIELEVAKEDDEIGIFNLPESIPSDCNKDYIEFNFTIANIGSDDQNNVEVVVDSSDLEFNERRRDIILNEGEEENLTFSIPIIAGIPNGTKQIKVTTYYERTKKSHEETVSVLIQECNVKELNFTFDIHLGWNMISLPLIPENNSAESLFGDCISTLDIRPVMAWDSPLFVEVDEIDPKKGYWLFSREETTCNVSGKKIENKTINLNVAWNMVGTVGLDSLDTKLIPKQVPQRPPQRWESPLFVDTYNIEPGTAAWVFLYEPTIVTISNNSRIHDTLEEGETKTYTINRNEYEVIVEDISKTGGQIKVEFTINSEGIPPLTEGDIISISEDIDIRINKLILAITEDVAANVTFTLNGNQKNLLIGDTKTFEINGKEYEVNLPVVGYDSWGNLVSKFVIEGETTDGLIMGQSYTFNDGLIISIDDITLENRSPSSSMEDMVTFFFEISDN